ncbi:MAG TPA: signal peptidase II [Rhodospirillales bacterium]|jgi:signal peptidase II|nr:MAG: Lipoprotein signal peptidase [Alphaproteobacteria bacterium MarineAlpha3_Bin2]HIM76461.1 signal peptidase II [Rhodospirillales bacterium]
MKIPPHVQKGLAMAAGVLAIDQITKLWIVFTVMQPPRIIEVTPFFNLVMGWNWGVSFGLLDSASEISQWLLPLVTVTITGGLVYWLYRENRRWTVIGLGLIIGGAVGNLVDRLHFGAVADFLDVHAFGYHWPAFNAADSAITVGAITVILESLFCNTKER